MADNKKSQAKSVLELNSFDFFHNSFNSANFFKKKVAGVDVELQCFYITAARIENEITLSPKKKFSGNFLPKRKQKT